MTSAQTVARFFRRTYAFLLALDIAARLFVGRVFEDAVTMSATV